MKQIVVAIVFCVSLSARAGAQTSELLLHATQCLAAKNFLPASKASSLNFGYLLDIKSYPGEEVLYLVQYTRSDRSRGLVYAVFFTEQHGQQTFNIQNNATFVRSKDGIDFCSPPLGGVWTQQHLVAAIEQIEQEPTFAVPTNDLSSPSSLIRCEAYTDKR